MQIMRLLTIKCQSRHYVRRPRLTLHVAPSGEREDAGRRRGCASVEANGRCRGCASVEAVVGGAV